LVSAVGDDGRNLDGQRAYAVAVKQVIQAVPEFRDHDEDAHALGDRMQLGRHAVAFDRRRQDGLRLFAAQALWRSERHAHEKSPALDVPELGAVGDVAVVLGKQARNGGDDAGFVGA
jgi:hypothetical protein